MAIPVSFDEVSYFNNQYRGDLIITQGVLYYFPHTRVVAARHAPEIGGKEAADVLNVLGLVVPVLGLAPWLHTLADKVVKIGKFTRRNLRPTINSPRVRSQGLWDGSSNSAELQTALDSCIDRLKAEPLKFEYDSVPKPMRFEAAEISQLRFGLKLRFDARFDSHDFRIHPLHRNLMKRALAGGGFLTKFTSADSPETPFR